MEMIRCYLCKHIWRCKSNKEEISCPKCHYKIKFSLCKDKIDRLIKHLNKKSEELRKSKKNAPHEEIPKNQEIKDNSEKSLPKQTENKNVVPKNEELKIYDIFGRVEKVIKYKKRRT